jgi:hypothetical protein
MLHMIGHAIFGLIIGLVARALMPGRQHMGLIMTMILGRTKPLPVCSAEHAVSVASVRIVSRDR